MNRNDLKILSLTLLIIICTSCDITSKLMARKHLHQSAPISVITNYLEFRYIENTTNTSSLLHSIDHNLKKWVIYCLSLLAVSFLSFLIWKVRNDSTLWLLSLMLVLSGVFSNLSEKFIRGYVIDFIHLHYYDKWSCPVFNLADILIICGAILLGIFILRNAPVNNQRFVMKKILDA